MRYRGRYQEPRTGLHVLNLVVLGLALLGILFVGKRAAEVMSEAFVDITEVPTSATAERDEDQIIGVARTRVAWALNETRRALRASGPTEAAEDDSRNDQPSPGDTTLDPPALPVDDAPAIPLPPTDGAEP